ncbi:17295_t:CDS:2 [Acaulospora morrowiae]|uniref:17295_t:CDS:1 n=1 Tax=Acaulospora morrowiae TaxID=94023 RepID=A0A9N9GS46_9GLOM|nr:17295_t:CDS:2 [Acaulospora morrowiae]
MINKAATDCSSEQSQRHECFGGTARHKTVIDRLRRENKNSLLLDGGDQFQGSLFFTYYNGTINSEVMNLLGYNVTAIGNHEFDKGPDVLTSHYSRLTMPIVCANINTTLNPTIGRYIKPYHIFEEYNLAVIGYITDTAGGISNSGPTLQFEDPIPIVQHYTNELRKMGIKRILTVSHNGYDADKELAAKTHGIAVHVGGHSHTLLSNDPKSKDYPLAKGPYPTVVKNAKGDDVLIVQAFWSGKYIGRLDVSFDEEGKLIEFSGAPILVGQSIPPDTAVEKLVKKWRAPFKKYAETIIGYANLPFEYNCQKHRECAMGNLVTDSILWSMRKILKVHAAFINSGGIRAGILKGNVTLNDILTILPFGNELVKLKLTGQNITDLLESAVSRGINKISGKKVTSFIQVSGLRFVLDSSKPIYHRVQEVQIQNNESKLFEELDLEKVYDIITLDFVANTGDGLLPELNQEIISLGTVDSAVISYIQSQGTIEPHYDARIRDLTTSLLVNEKPFSPHEPVHFGYMKSNLNDLVREDELVSQEDESLLV